VLFQEEKNTRQNAQESTVISDLQTDRIENNESAKTLIDKHAIFLFGGFRVIDKDGRNLTGEFSSLLKQLFLIILLNTLKDGKGISSLKLRETLWFDKTQESARNNRGVLLSRLRQTFKQVGIINIENKNSLWTIEFGDDIYCDYYEAITLMKRLKNEDSLTNKDVRELLFTVSGGGMLPNLQIDWIDSFKADFSNNLIDTLLYIVQHPNLNLSPQECIDLADAIFIHDFLNESALKIKCKTLIKMGKNGLAKSVYTSFVKEYHTAFGSKFKYSFDQIIF
jgi:two-component SAPR family response regulator